MGTQLPELMSFEPNVSNRLHRSGAIDFNVEFNLRQAQLQAKDKNSDGKKTYKDNGITPDTPSVCEGEPLFYVNCKRTKFGGGCATTRKPIQLLSSLNGIALKDDDKKATHDVPETDPTKLCNKIREDFFKTVRPNGISVTKYAFSNAGKQGPLFVATMGGANTIYVDEDVYAGDTLIVDIPLSSAGDMPIQSHTLQHIESANCQNNLEVSLGNPYGFVHWQNKRGVPKAKRTLTVRALPLPCYTGPDQARQNEANDFEAAFYHRRQVIGQCTKGAKRGERCDLILGANSVGTSRPLKRQRQRD